MNNVTNLYTIEDSEYLKKNPTWHVEHAGYKSNLVLKMIEKHKILLEKSALSTQFVIGEVGCGGGGGIR
jgi:hypothetical protein